MADFSVHPFRDPLIFEKSYNRFLPGSLSPLSNPFIYTKRRLVVHQTPYGKLTPELKSSFHFAGLDTASADIHLSYCTVIIYSYALNIRIPLSLSVDI